VAKIRHLVRYVMYYILTACSVLSCTACNETGSRYLGITDITYRSRKPFSVRCC